MLNMKKQCEQCGQATPQTAVAYICSYECTFCEQCTTTFAHTCPNCNGNLVLRPLRTKNPVHALATQVKNKFFKK